MCECIALKITILLDFVWLNGNIYTEFNIVDYMPRIKKIFHSSVIEI